MRQGCLEALGSPLFLGLAFGVWFGAGDVIM
jgi:hypothetical protein